jgi:hypothetical protein
MRKGIVNSKTGVVVLSFFVVLAVVGFATASANPGKADNPAGGAATLSASTHSPCNQGVGNGADDMCDPGRSNHGDPYNSNDELGGVPGDPGRQGGNK